MMQYIAFAIYRDKKRSALITAIWRGIFWQIIWRRWILSSEVASRSKIMVLAWTYFRPKWNKKGYKFKCSCSMDHTVVCNWAYIWFTPISPDCRPVVRNASSEHAVYTKLKSHQATDKHLSVWQLRMADGVAGYLSSGKGLTRVLVTVRSNVQKFI